MSEIKDNEKVATKKKTTKTSSKKSTSKKTPTKKSTTKKEAVQDSIKPIIEEKKEPVIEIEIPRQEGEIEMSANEKEETAITEPKIEIEIPEVVLEPVVKETAVTEPIVEEPINEPVIDNQPVYSEPIVETNQVIPDYEPVTSQDNGYKARPISEIIAETQEEPKQEEQVVEQPTNEPVIENQPVYQEPVIVDNNFTNYEQNVNVEEPINTFNTEPVVEEPTYEEMPSMEPTLINNYEEKVEAKPKKKKDIRMILLVLLFVFLFLFIMFMPQIQDAINSIKKETGLSEIEKQAKEIEKEQNKANGVVSQEEESKEQYLKLTCTSTTTALEDYDRTVVETFEYNSKKEVMASAKKVTYTFITANESYENLKTQCNENSLKYVSKKGYEIACSYNDTQVVIEDKFDLKNFSTIKDGTTIIAANAKYKDKIDTIKTKLEALDYTCE